MTNSKVSVLFPGQGAFYCGALKDIRATHPQIDTVISEIDRAAKPALNASVADVLFGRTPADVAESFTNAPPLSQMMIYTISLAVYRVLQAQGLQPSVLMGHSFGEIAALVAGGWFSVEQGAEIVLHRTAALQALGKAEGYMAALATDRSRAEKILDLAGGKETAIASENHSGQTVISGRHADMDRCMEIAKLLQISFVKLNSPYPFHSPLLKAACADYASRIRHIEAKQGQVPVFSPILNRYYDAKDVLSDCLAEHLVTPVNFATGVQRLYKDGVRVFVESGALTALTKLTSLALGKSDVQTVACLDPGSGEFESFKKAVNTLTAHGLLKGHQPAPSHSVLLPHANPQEFESFWEARGRQILALVEAEFQEFEKAALAKPIEKASAPPKAVEQVTPQAVPEAKPAAAMSRADLFAKIAATYADALEYPQEVFTETVELEAELGIDSVKQTELLARLGEQYNLPPRTPDFRLSDYNTLGKVVDLVYAARPQAPPKDAAVNNAPAPMTAVVEAAVSRAQLFNELAAMYAAALEYPQEVFTETVELEAELGIDSVKQTELLARVGERYNMPPRTPEFRLSDYNTMGKVVDLVAAASQSKPHVKRAAEHGNGNGMAHALVEATAASYRPGSLVN
jgi:acyl transferase domain-containing protein